eukprot:superscaffoldBa00002378_g14069
MTVFYSHFPQTLSFPLFHLLLAEWTAIRKHSIPSSFTSSMGSPSPGGKRLRVSLLQSEPDNLLYSVSAPVTSSSPSPVPPVTSSVIPP